MKGKKKVSSTAPKSATRKQVELWLRAQHELLQTLTRAQGLTDTLRLCLETAIQVSEMDSGGIYLVDAAGGLRLACAAGVSAEFLQAVSYYPPEHRHTRLVQAGKPIHLPHHDLPGLDFNDFRLDEHLQALAVIPIRVDERIIGSLNVASHTINVLSLAHRQVLETVVSSLGLIISRVQADEALRESEKRYRAILEDQTEVIGRFQADGTILFVNNAYCRFFGKTDVELLGQKWQQLAISNEVQHIEEKLETLSPDNPVVVIENQARSADGQLHWMQFVNRGFFDAQGQLSEIQFVGRDITERKQAEESLRVSEQKFSIMFEKAPFAAALAKLPNSLIIQVNQAFEKMLGYARQEVLGKTYLELGLHHASGRRAQLITELLARGSLRDVEQVLLTKAGEERLFLVNLDVVEFGGEKYMLQTAQDITERKRAEGKLKELSRRIVATQEAERKHISQELHDELGQALTAISLDLNGVEKALPPDLQVRAREQLAEARALADEVDERISQMALDLRPSMLDDLGLLPTLQWYLKRFSQRTGIKVTFGHLGMNERLPEEVETTLYRVIQEALTNVVRHARAQQVAIQLENSGTGITASIEDDGQGFDLAALQSPSTAAEGVGLLGIRERVSSLGGTAEINSVQGRGTQIRIEIPL